MSAQKYDLLIIGGGPGGYTAAIAGAQARMKTILAEQGHLGGTCLNRGCVPTKTILQDVRLLSVLRNSHFLTGQMRVDPAGIENRKNMVVEGSRAWLQNLLAGNGVTVIKGRAFFLGPREVALLTPEGETINLRADRIVISTGAREKCPEGLAPDGRAVWSTDDAIGIAEPPRTLIVVGGGARGVELAQVYRHLGCRVALMEKDRRLLPRMDRSISSRFRKALLEKGIKVLTGTTARSARTDDDLPDSSGHAILEYQDKKGSQTARADRILLCLPRRPSLGELNIEAAGLSLDDGLLTPGAGQETAVKGIYVIGDAAGPPYWAHKAIAQGLTAIRHMSGREQDGRPRFVPACVYGDPEIASVGLTEAEVKASGRSFKLGEFHFIGNGRAGTLGESQGLVRFLSETESGRILGVHIIGPGATEMISLGALAMENDIGLAGIKKTVFGHPTLAESFFEAALASDNQAIHMLLAGVQSEVED